MQLNEGIRDKEVRVISETGEQLGIMSGKEALELAITKDLDLVKIAPLAKPPVCKIIDYGKYKFDLAKKEKEAKKKQHVVEVKEIRLSLNIDTNDLNTKLKQSEKFVRAGNKLKVSIRFRGREMGHPEIGNEIMKKFAASCSEFAKVESHPKLMGRSMFMFLAPLA